MFVYVVNRVWPYEGEETEGVFSTLENAKAFRDKMIDDSGYNDIVIYEYDVDNVQSCNGWIAPE